MAMAKTSAALRAPSSQSTPVWLKALMAKPMSASADVRASASGQLPHGLATAEAADSQPCTATEPEVFSYGERLAMDLPLDLVPSVRPSASNRV
jgi:hypothetical protein